MSAEDEPDSDLDMGVVLPKPPLPKEYAEAGLTQIFDEKLGWIIVNADGSKLWPMPHAAQFYYPKEKP